MTQESEKSAKSSTWPTAKLLDLTKNKEGTKILVSLSKEKSCLSTYK